ncbi:MAG: IS200/IS605 family transposase, partial [Candidatus Poribacteria bacterium]|nr:IS200/IS605 family transposase [Candidatus Poribacteria bacterium]
MIWRTKYRRKVLDESIQERLHPLICAKQTELDFRVCTSEMMQDHVHLIIENNPKVPVTRTVGLLKGYTSKMLREEFPHLKSRLPTLWTRSKFISSVGSVTLEV